METNAIVLAGGRGTRMNDGQPSDIPKVLHYLAHRPMIDYVIRNLKKAGFVKPIVVVGYRGELVKKHLGKSCQYVSQEKQLGTGHAVAVVKKILAGRAGATLVTYGDMPFWTAGTYKKLVEIFRKEKPAFVLASVRLGPEYLYGRLIKDSEGRILESIEVKNALPEQLKKFKDQNPCLYCFDNQWLFANLPKVKKNPVSGEYYLTDLVGLAVGQGEKIVEFKVRDSQQAIGVNSRQELKIAEKILTKNTNTRIVTNTRI